MKKNILILLGLLFVTACSQNKPEVEAQPTIVKTPIKTEVSNNEVPTEFIPEHIKRSKIEVVKHY